MAVDGWAATQAEEWSPEGFWASYSDVMAGILMVFALASLYMTFRVVSITDTMKEWNANNAKICEALEGIPDVSCKGGAVVFLMSEEWFDFNETTLKERGKEILRRVIPAYMEKVTQNPGFWDRVEMIEVGGHADRRVIPGRRGANVWVSSVRALQVMEFLLTDETLGPYRQKFFERGTVIGYGDSRIPAECNSSPGFQETGECAVARRVEIRSTPRNQDILAELSRLLTRER